MDKIERYQNAIIEFLEEEAKLKPSNLKNVENQIIIDQKNQHFQLLVIGWEDSQFTFHAVFHFDIKDGKVWIQRNDTEAMVADELIERGVAREDIVLGFQPPYARPYTGFATA